MQHRDIPIEKAEQDKLNFSDFADKVAKGILNYSQTETFIFSIEGEWGSGKTSLINLIENKIKSDVEILHFNPWLLTDIRQVIKLFFDELTKVLSHGSFDIKFNEEIKKDLIKFASLILPESLTIDVKFVKFGYKPKDILLPSGEENIEQIKEKINGYLKSLNKKIVIIVDDIDRLTDIETEFIFRLTKGIADFNNLIYILLYDKAVVTKSLQKFKSENGEKYLEKIVQYSLNVPKPHENRISRLLFEELDEIILKLEQDGKKYVFQKDRWHYVQKAIKKYFKTVRDITQIINIMSFEYPLICEDVNFTDFFILSLIRLKNYELYEAIKNQSENFFLVSDNLYSEKAREQEKEKIQKNFDENLKTFHHFRDLLKIAFPAIEKETLWSQENGKRHQNKFIRDLYYFENYFAFSMSDDKLTMKEYYKIEEKILSNDFTEFKNLMLEIDRNKKSSIFLDMFNEFKADSLNDGDEVENCFMNFLKISGFLESTANGLLTAVPIYWHLLYLAFNIAFKHPAFEDFLQQVIVENQELSLKIKIEFYEYVKKEIVENYKYKNLAIDEKTSSTIETKLRNELEKIHLNDFIEAKYETYLVHKFELVEGCLTKLSEELKNFIFISHEHFFTVLESFKTFSIINGSYKKYYIAKDSLAKLIELTDIEKYIQHINQEMLNESQKKLLEYWEKGERWYD